jgi:hypothetical protein
MFGLRHFGVVLGIVAMAKGLASGKPISGVSFPNRRNDGIENAYLQSPKQVKWRMPVNASFRSSLFKSAARA